MGLIRTVVRPQNSNPVADRWLGEEVKGVYGPMAKFIKSFFNTAERRRNSRYEDIEDDKTNATPALDIRRKLSISRSGRMRQANKKRHSLSLELYDQEIQMKESKCNEIPVHKKQTVLETKMSAKQRSQSTELNTPDEEIDKAFEVIDKSLTTDIL